MVYTEKDWGTVDNYVAILDWSDTCKSIKCHPKPVSKWTIKNGLWKAGMMINPKSRRVHIDGEFPEMVSND